MLGLMVSMILVLFPQIIRNFKSFKIILNHLKSFLMSKQLRNALGATGSARNKKKTVWIVLIPIGT